MCCPQQENYINRFGDVECHDRACVLLILSETMSERDGRKKCLRRFIYVPNITPVPAKYGVSDSVLSPPPMEPSGQFPAIRDRVIGVVVLLGIAVCQLFWKHK